MCIVYMYIYIYACTHTIYIYIYLCTCSAYIQGRKINLKVKREKGWGMIFEIHSELTYNVIQLRAHARTKRNDFAVEHTPTSDLVVFLIPVNCKVGSSVKGF